jgi:hypothetical protein
VLFPRPKHRTRRESGVSLPLSRFHARRCPQAELGKDQPGHWARFLSFLASLWLRAVVGRVGRAALVAHYRPRAHHVSTMILWGVCLVRSAAWTRTRLGSPATLTEKRRGPFRFTGAELRLRAVSGQSGAVGKCRDS